MRLWSLCSGFHGNRCAFLLLSPPSLGFIVQGLTCLSGAQSISFHPEKISPCPLLNRAEWCAEVSCCHWLSCDVMSWIWVTQKWEVSEMWLTKKKKLHADSVCDGERNRYFFLWEDFFFFLFLWMRQVFAPLLFYRPCHWLSASPSWKMCKVKSTALKMAAAPLAL